MPYSVIFGGFCNLLLVMSAQVFVSAKNPPKKILYGICHSLAPLKATKVPKVPFCNPFWVLVHHTTLGRYLSNSQDHFISLTYVVSSWNILGAWNHRSKISFTTSLQVQRAQAWALCAMLLNISEFRTLDKTFNHGGKHRLLQGRWWTW